MKTILESIGRTVTASAVLFMLIVWASQVVLVSL
jgi:hypothetical protein